MLPVILAVGSLLVKSAFLVDLLAFGLIFQHDNFETDPAKFNGVADPQMQPTICRRHIKTMGVCKLNNLPGFVCWLQFLFLVILNQKFVVNPEFT